MSPVLALADARARDDPTGTSGLRRAFRAAGKLRLRQMRAAMRVAVMEHDVLGFSGGTVGALAYQPPETRLRAFAAWVDASAAQYLSGPWLNQWLATAWDSGERVGFEQMSRERKRIGGSGALLELARVEVDGIRGEIVRHVARAAAVSIMRSRTRRDAWVRVAKAFDAAGPTRMSALANTFTVLAHNRGKITSYRAEGVTRVGVIPEKMSRHGHLLRLAFDAFNPDQPREPAGSPEGGRWAGAGGMAREETGGREKGGAKKSDPEMEHAWAARDMGKYASLMGDRCRSIAKEMKLDPGFVKVSTKNSTGAFGTTMGVTDNAATSITMYARACPPDTFAGTFVHEATHVKYTRMREAYKAQRAEVEKLSDAQRAAAFAEGKYRLYQEFENVYDVAELRKEGGVTPYSKMWWGKTAGGQWVSSAVYETLAEMARVKWETGELPGGPRHQALYDLMNSDWYGRRPQPGYADAVLEEHAGAIVVWLTEDFRPCEPEQAFMGKVIHEDGRVEFVRAQMQPRDAIAVAAALFAKERAKKKYEYEEEPIEVGIRTAGDDRVCEDCEEYAENGPYDIDEVEDTLPLHINCRCTWYPWNDKRYKRDYDPSQPRGPDGKWIETGAGEEKGGDISKGRDVASKIAVDLSLTKVGEQTQPVKSLDELYFKCLADEKWFKDQCSDLADAFGAEVVYTPPEYAEPGTILKSRKSAERKLKAELGNDPRLIKDVLRSTIVTKTVRDTRAAALKFIEEQGDRVVRVKDRIVTPVDGGYRDILINVRTKSGLIAEVQFNSKNMLEAKFGKGHQLYEYIRANKQNMLPEQRIALEKEGEALYNNAYEADGDGKWGIEHKKIGGKPFILKWFMGGKDAEPLSVVKAYRVTSPAGETFEVAVVSDGASVPGFRILSNRFGKWAPEKQLQLEDLMFPEQELTEWEVRWIDPVEVNLTDYDPSQPRGPDGRWIGTGASGETLAFEEKSRAVEHWNNLSEKAKDYESKAIREAVYYGFPRLDPNNYSIIGARDNQFNCIGYAFGDERRQWFPGSRYQFWPGREHEEHFRSDIIQREADDQRLAFDNLLLGEAEGEDDADESVEPGYIKLALYEDIDGSPTHLARQTPDGKWRSKLGNNGLIEHTLKELEEGQYGGLATIYKIKVENWRKIRSMK